MAGINKYPLKGESKFWQVYNNKGINKHIISLDEE